MALPGVLDGGKTVTDRVRSTDIAPTVLEVEGLEPDPRMSGRSLLPLVRGRPRARSARGRERGPAVARHPLGSLPHGDPRRQRPRRPVRSRRGPGRAARRGPRPRRRGRGAAGATGGRPGERSGGRCQGPRGHRRGADGSPALRDRRAGAHRVSGELRVGDAGHAATFTFEPVGVAREALHADGPVLAFALTTSATGLVGLDLRTDPPGPPSRGSCSSTMHRGLPGRRSRAPSGCPPWPPGRASSTTRRGPRCTPSALPVVDPARDLGLFVTRDRPADHAGEAATEQSGRRPADAAGPPAVGIRPRQPLECRFLAATDLRCARSHAPRQPARPGHQAAPQGGSGAGARAARRDPRRGPRRRHQRARARRGGRAARAHARRGRGAHLRAPRRARAGRARRADGARVGGRDRQRDGARRPRRPLQPAARRRWASSSSRPSRRSIPRPRRRSATSRSGRRPAPAT